MIMLQTLTDDTQTTQKAIHIHEKESLSNIEKMLQMSKECILVEDFNLHHFT